MVREDYTEQQALDALMAYAEKVEAKIPGSRAKMTAVFNDPKARAKIPSPGLRAALASLVGTFAEDAIDYVLNAILPNGKPVVTGVEFVSTLPDGLFAAARPTTEPRQKIIVFNSKIMGENPVLYGYYLAHEALHMESITGDVANYPEEFFANTIGALIYLNQLYYNRELASLKTTYVRITNRDAVTILNSGQKSRLGLYATNGNAKLLPGFLNPANNNNENVQSFNDFIQLFYRFNSTTDEGVPLIQKFLERLAGGPQPCPTNEFSDALNKCVDEMLQKGVFNADFLKPEGLLAIARDALGLNIPEPPKVGL